MYMCYVLFYNYLLHTSLRPICVILATHLNINSTVPEKPKVKPVLILAAIENLVSGYLDA